MSAGVSFPWWTWILPAAALALAGVEHGGAFPVDGMTTGGIVGALLLGAVFAAVHHAETVAAKVGQPLGSVVLALAVTVIETSLIITAMTSAGARETALARDTVFAAILIILNGIVGICLLVGGLRHHEQGFRVEGTASALSVIATLAVLALVLPNFTITKLGPQYSPTQLVFVGTLSLVLFFVFTFVQSWRHRDYFRAAAGDEPEHEAPSAVATALSAVLLIAALLAVVLLAEALSPMLERAIRDAGLPASFFGVVISALVLLPESGAAVRAAYDNRVQTSLNLALGSAIATIGLTIPAVVAASLYLGLGLILGLDYEGMALLLLTLFVSTLTLATGRATILQGAVHLVIFGVFLLLAAVP